MSKLLLSVVSTEMSLSLSCIDLFKGVFGAVIKELSLELVSLCTAISSSLMRLALPNFFFLPNRLLNLLPDFSESESPKYFLVSLCLSDLEDAAVPIK